MRCERDELQDPLDVGIAETGVEQPFRGAAADESLRAGACIDTRRLDADDPPGAALGGGSDSDQRHHLLRRELRHRCAPLERVTRGNPDLGAAGALTVDHVCRDVLCELLDEERLADYDLFDRFFEELREPRHVHALLCGVEVDAAVDLGGDQLLCLAPPEANGLRHAAHAGARQPERDFRRRCLQILQQLA